VNPKLAVGRANEEAGTLNMLQQLHTGETLIEIV
jgi:hypothetical protein